MCALLKSYVPCGPLGFPLSEKQARNLDTLLKALPKSKEFEYRKTVFLKAPTEVNPGERSDVSWISTETPDRYDHVVFAKGMNDSQFALNPIVTLNHDYTCPPIGRSLWRKFVKGGDTRGIKAKTVYPPMPASWPAGECWEPDKVFAQIQAGLLNAKSIGWLPTKARKHSGCDASTNAVDARGSRCSPRGLGVHMNNGMIQKILDKAAAGERLAFAEGVALFDCKDLNALGRAADAVARRLHPEPVRTYNIDRNINYTNVCAAVCDFCAFFRKSGDADGYVLSRAELYKKIDETIALGGDQALLQGGNHPTLKLEWYEELLRDLKTRYPSFNLHAFSAPEIWNFAKINKLPLGDVLARLKAAGMGSLPGGGGEILVDRVRKAITVNKCLTDDWLAVHRAWHQLGGRSTCTMMFGHVETLPERIEHLERLRQLQDETHGFTAFICWTLQPPGSRIRKGDAGTDMSGIPPAGSFEYLRTQAIARLYLDNIPNIQSSWVTQGLKVGQLALMFGANDMGSLMIEENVVASAGTVHYLTLEQIKNAIRELGYQPRQRNVFYEYVDHPSKS